VQAESIVISSFLFDAASPDFSFEAGAITQVAARKEISENGASGHRTAQIFSGVEIDMRLTLDLNQIYLHAG